MIPTPRTDALIAAFGPGPQGQARLREKMVELARDLERELHNLGGVAHDRAETIRILKDEIRQMRETPCESSSETK